MEVGILVNFNMLLNFLVGAFRRKTQTIVMTFLFLKTNEVTDFISFIS